MGIKGEIMKISRARLKQIINESYQKILLQENPVVIIGGITIAITSTAVITGILTAVLGACLCRMYKLHRTAFAAPNASRLNSAMSNDSILNLISIAYVHAKKDKDDGMLSEIKKAKNLSEELASQLGLRVDFSDISLGAIDIVGGLAQFAKSSLGSVFGVVTAAFEISEFEYNLDRLDEEKVKTCINTLEAILDYAFQVKAGTIGQGKPVGVKMDSSGDFTQQR